MPLYLDASITTVDGAFTVNDDPIDVADGSEWPAGNFTIKVWDQSDVTILKAVIYVGTRSTNALSNLTWDFGGHTDVNLADGDYVALEIAAPNYPPPYWNPVTPAAYDDYFQVDNSADWTTVSAASGATTWRYLYEARLGLGRGLHANGNSNSNTYATYVKPLSGIAIGDYVQGAVDLSRRLQGNEILVGLCFTDGTTNSSTFAGGGVVHENNAINQFFNVRGTLNTPTTVEGLHRAVAMKPLHLRLTYSAANTFQMGMSLDGDAFLNYGAAITGVTLTPTHGGMLFQCEDSTGGLGQLLYFHSNVTP